MDHHGDAQPFIRELMAWAHANPKGCRTGGAFPDHVAHIQLHYRPDPRGPEAQLTLQAALVDGQAVIQVELPTSAATSRELRVAPDQRHAAIFSGTNLPPREPEETCEACGVRGTVGRAVRTDGKGAVEALHRFCGGCWPEHSARYRARWEEEQRLQMDAFFSGNAPAEAGSGKGMAFEAATWHTTLDLVRDIQKMMMPQRPPSPADLASLAAQIRQGASELDGPMPFEVVAFLQRYGAGAG